jgi:hypothetical protein
MPDNLMEINRFICALLLSLWVLFSGCRSIVGAQPPRGIQKLKFLDEFEIQYNMQFKGTVVGGLSGIDYDLKSDTYFIISDDRSSTGPPRFYKVKIIIQQNQIDTVRFLSVNSLEPTKQVSDSAAAPDPEAIRVNPDTQELIWTSEGERVDNGGKKLLIDPAIYIRTLDGSFVSQLIIPNNVRVSFSEKGPRRNGTFEGVTFNHDFSAIFASMEEPLYEDGPRMKLERGSSWVRIYKFDTQTKQNIVQYAYQPEPVAFAATPPNTFMINGISEIVSATADELLVVERSFSSGRQPCTIKVFLATLNNAEDVKDVGSLAENPPAKPVRKRLLLNMDDLGIYIDNVEGVTWGPVLPNGHRTLLFVSDNNFIASQKTQVLLFEVIE